jgi:branched-chain amino acid transport system ATP-binding protein
MTALLSASGVHAAYADLRVVRDVSVEVDDGQIVALLGPNGAGKTTFLRVVSGLQRPVGGSVSFAGDDITGLPAHQVVKRGMAMVPEGKQLWPTMSVDDHLRIAATGRGLSGEEEREQRRLVFELFPVLEERLSSLANTFSGGQQQMLAIARALMSRPRLLLLDEPSLGLAPMVVATVFKTIARIRDEGVSVLIVEQNVRQALSLADRGYFMDRGSIFKSGTATELSMLATTDLAELAL